jgi:negative regulator of sigma E activity
MTMDTDRHTNDLTQLSSREQLSALMDGALSEDQTRFLLRRLQHDHELAGCWERWRIAGDAMRGTVSASPLSEGFSARVVAAIQGEPLPVTPSKPRWPAWIHWSGGAAVAATVAAIAFLLQPTPSALPEAAPMLSAAPGTSTAAAEDARVAQERLSIDVAEAAAEVAQRPPPVLAERQVQKQPVASPAPAPAPQRTLIAQMPASPQTPPVMDVASPDSMPAQEATTRPWPRSVLSQYGHGAMAAGFSDGFLQNGSGNPFATAPFSSAPKLSTQSQRSEQRDTPQDNADEMQRHAPHFNKEGS